MESMGTALVVGREGSGRIWIDTVTDLSESVKRMLAF
jgi:hypothetical protein